MKIAHWLLLGAALFSSHTSLGKSESPIAASRFAISIDGVQVSATSVVGGGAATDKLSASTAPLQIAIDRTGSEAMWQWISTSINQGPTEKKVDAQAKGKRRATFTSAMVTEVKFDDLDANDSKKPMQLRVTVVPKQIVAAADLTQSAPTSAQKRWSPSNFRVKIGGLPLAKVKKIEAFTIKQKVVENGKLPMFVLESMRLTLASAEAKTVSDALAKDKTNALTIALTNDDGSVWKTLSVSGLTIQSSKPSGASSSITMKGSKILIN